MDPNTAPPLNAGAPKSNKTSPWLYVGCGCLVAIVLAIVVVLFVGRGVVQHFKKFSSDMADPAKRDARTRALLGYRELPEGYFPGVAVSVPFITDVAILTDHQDAAGPFSQERRNRMEFDRHAFIFMRFLVKKLPDDDSARRNLLSDHGGDNAWSRGFRVDSSTSLGDGEVEGGHAKVYYRAVRGYTNLNGHSQNSITAVMVVACPDRDMRNAVWTIHDPTPDAPADKLDKTGTPADPAAITAFLNHFDLCGGAAGGGS